MQNRRAHPTIAPANTIANATAVDTAVRAADLNPPPPIIDIGVNLAHDSFDTDREAVIERAFGVGVTRMLITGSSLASTRAALALVRQRPLQLRCTSGVHPHHADDLQPAQFAELAELAQLPQCLAVGECGLDYYRNFAPRQAQLDAFRRQLELAVQVGKPVFLHERDAHADFRAMLEEFRGKLAGGVAHCFTGTQQQAQSYLELGLHLGITGWICDERRGVHLREVVRHIPAERLLIETDAPYLLPRDLRPRPSSRRNEPMYLPHVLQAIAAARGATSAELAHITTANAQRLFGWPAGTA
jgi:TatD DNase family protein